MITKLLMRFFPRLITSKRLIKYLRKKGIEIGDKTVFFNAGSINIDCSRPILIKIGKYCKITGGVTILSHDYSRSVLRRVYGDIIAEARQTIIGNNVFIGMNSILLMGCKIGDNCIVGAGSVLHGTYPSNSVIAGNPAKVILSLDDYYQKRKNKYIEEATLYAKLFLEKNHRKPTINEMGAFFPLYLDRSIDEIYKNKLRTNLSGDEEKEIINKFLESDKYYKSYEDFIKTIN